MNLKSSTVAILKAVLKIFLIIPGFGVFNNTDGEYRCSNRPHVHRNTLYTLFGECLDPRRNGVLFVHGEMHRDLSQRSKDTIW